MGLVAVQDRIRSAAAGQVAVRMYSTVVCLKNNAFGRLELEWCERKILLGWLELELVAGVA